MKKWIGFGVLVAALVVAWGMFIESGSRIEAVERQIGEARDNDDPEGVVEELGKRKVTLEGQRVFNGILLTFLCAGVGGILFVVYVLPGIAHRMAHAVYDSGEEVEPDGMHDARALVAQGNYEEAIEAFEAAAERQPLNRVPWVEISKIQRDHLHDPMEAIRTIQRALAGQEWEADDAAFFLFRLAEIHDRDAHDREAAAGMLRRVMERFPETRHAANARHKLNEWGLV